MSYRNKILLVEDNLGDVKLIEYILESLPINPTLVHFETGKAFVDAVNANEIDISSAAMLILDFNLPMLNAEEMLIRLKKNDLKHLPVVILSSSNSPIDIRKTYEAGASAFVTKPVNLDEFENRIKAIVEFWLIHNQLP